MYVYAGPHVCKTKLMAFVFDGDLRASITAVLSYYWGLLLLTTVLWQTISLTIYLNSNYHWDHPDLYFVLISIYIC